MGFFISDEDKDAFWDLSELIPKKRKPISEFSRNTDLTEISVSHGSSKEDTRKDSEKSREREFSFQPIEKKENNQSVCLSYTPSDNKFIRKVVISEEKEGYNFYGSFKKDAERYYNAKGKESEFVPYFSNVPQYSQLTEEQKNYYFFWRERVREGEYIKCDYSYFWLYVYEVVNLSSQITPADGIKLLCSVWREYRKQLPAIDKNMTAWVCDYCLVHSLPCPTEEISSFICEIIEFMPLKEFYLASTGSFDEIDVDYIIGVASDYNWHMSKILKTGKNSEFFLTHMNASLKAPFRLLFENGEMSLSADEIRSMRYSAFNRSLCGYFIRKSIYVEYCSLSHSEKIRNTVTQTVKYAENRLRAFLSVKSRLSTPTLQEEYKTAIDTYYDSLIRKRDREREMSARPSYERLYDAQENGLSFSYAEKIEESSWELARRLAPEEEICEVFSAEKQEPPKAESIPVCKQEFTEIKSEDKEKNSKESLYGLSPFHVEFVEALLDKSFAHAKQIASEAGGTPESLSEKINESFSDFFGDVIIEIGENGCVIISDYETEVTEWLKEN